MKTFLLATVLAAASFNGVQAQLSATNALTPAAKPMMSKEEKNAAKAKKEADLVEAFTKAGLTADEQNKVRAILDASGEKSKAIKADAVLNEADKKAKLEESYKERNDNLKAAVDEAKYKSFKAAQKAQKEASAQ